MAGKFNANRLALFLLFPFLLSSCHVFRSLYWNVTDLNDYKKFPADSISRAAVPAPFKEALVSHADVLDHFAYDGISGSSLNSFLESHETVAFLIIRNDSLVYEQYFGGYARSSVIPSFSVAKSFVSSLIGTALRDGYIRSIDQPVTDFLPELKDPGFKKVTLRNLLEMRSGIEYDEGYLNPFGEVTRFYYGLNIRKFTENLRIKGPANEAYEYQSANTELLALVIEKATGKAFHSYFSESIWSPMGTEFDASWSYDSKRHHTIKAFCCLNARPVDFAKFGRLFLDHGMVAGKAVVPEEWVQESLTIVNDSRDSDGYPYTYQWRVTADGDFFAKGVGGQYIFVSPRKHTIIVRFGRKYAGVPWAAMFKAMCDVL
jgi:CubicO group peptidase (beta-lactamase class C family)